MTNIADKLAAALRDCLKLAYNCHRDELPGAIITTASKAVAEYDAQRESEKRTFTVFCREASGDGTIFISSAEGICAEEAARKVLDECAEAWGMNSGAIDVIGIATGNVQIVDWQDEPHSGGIVLESLP